MRAAAALCLLACAAPAETAADWRDRLEVSGTVEIEWALATRSGDSRKLEAVVQPEFNLDLNDRAAATAVLRLRGDAHGELDAGGGSPGARSALSRRLAVGDRLGAELREFYVDMELGFAALRLGKQQVAWGQADGLKVLDVVNPQSFREFILDGFDDSRIPLWTVNAEIPLSQDSQLQFLWIPDPTYHDLPQSGAAYEFTSPRLAPPAGVPLRPARRPSNPLRDSDVGLRYSTFLDGWDITLNYFYHYHDFAVPYRAVQNGAVVVAPEYARAHLLGGTLSKAFGDVTLRSELGYSSRSYFTVQDAADADGVKSSGEISYVVGLDYGGLDDTLLSAQLFQSALTESVAGALRDSVESTVTLLVERTFANETWRAEALLLHSLNDGDGAVRPKLSYEYASNIVVWAGADIFRGAPDGLFGQFGGRDRIVLGLEWGF